MKKVITSFLLFLNIVFLSCAEDQLVLIDKGILNSALGSDQNIEISSFYISESEVKVSEWKEYLHDNGYDFEWNRTNHSLSPNVSPFRLEENDNWPMYNITWLEAVQYCNWLSIKKGMEKVYKVQYISNGNVDVTWDKEKRGYRLPTELEWEYAASGGPHGNDTIYSGSDALDDVAWYEKNSKGYPKEVKLKLANEVGVYDMSGNVDEWCWDYYDSQYIPLQSNVYGPLVGNAHGFVGDGEELLRVVRGGSCLDPERICRVKKRGAYYQDSISMIGFRVVLDKELNK